MGEEHEQNQDVAILAGATSVIATEAAALASETSEQVEQLKEEGERQWNMTREMHDNMMERISEIGAKVESLIAPPEPQSEASESAGSEETSTTPESGAGKPPVMEMVVHNPETKKKSGMSLRKRGHSLKLG